MPEREHLHYISKSIHSAMVFQSPSWPQVDEIKQLAVQTASTNIVKGEVTNFMHSQGYNHGSDTFALPCACASSNAHELQNFPLHKSRN